MSASIDRIAAGRQAPRTSIALGWLANVAPNAAFVAILIVVGATTLVWGGRGFPNQPMSFLRGPVGFVEVAVLAVTFGGIGAFLATRLPGHAVGWSLILIGAGVALHAPASFAVGQTLQSFRAIPSLLLVSVWALTSAFVPLMVALIGYLLMILPDGRLHSRRWAFPLGVLLLGFHILTAATALEPSGLVWFPTLPNPLSIPTTVEPWIAAARVLGVGLLVFGLAAAAGAMVNRYRCGDKVVRLQLRWIAGGAVTWAATLVPFIVIRYLIGASDDVGSFVMLLAGAGMMAIPISIFIATTRYHLFGIDAVIGGTLVYVPLMGICGGLYAAALALAQRLFVSLTGNTSDGAVIVATLLMAAAFTHLRRLLESGVDQLMAGGPGSAATSSSDTSSVPAGTSDNVRLAQEAATLSTRLEEVEAAIAELGPLERRDGAREAGEPGVGLGIPAATMRVPPRRSRGTDRPESRVPMSSRRRTVAPRSSATRPGS